MGPSVLATLLLPATPPAPQVDFDETSTKTINYGDFNGLWLV
jgi:hypothetical protein